MHDDEWMITLKDGSSADARVVRAYWSMLRAEDQDHPEVIVLLHDVAIGMLDALPKSVKQKWCGKRKGLDPTLKAVLLNSIDPETLGWILPYKETPENKHVWDTAEDAVWIRKKEFLKQMRGIDDMDEGESQFRT